MKIKRILSAAVALALGTTIFTGCGSGDSESGKKGKDGSESGKATVLNIAIQPSASFIPLYIAREKGWIEEALKDQGVTVNWNDFESGPPMNESLAAGESDIGVVGDVPVVSAIAAGQDNEIIAIASHAPESYGVVVAADSDINTAADLKGKTLATTIGSTSHEHLDMLLEANGIDINTEVQLVNISTGDAATVLSNHEADAVALWEPNITRLVDSGTAKLIATGNDCGLLGINPIVARADYAENNKEIIKVFIEQYARAIKEVDNLDEETLAKVAEDLSLTPEQIVSLRPKYDYVLRVTDEDAPNLQKTIQFLVKIGNLEEEYDIKDYIKSEYTENADISQYLD
ncbi:MAG: aliphatic sulfonate ABC transporter substrate-binding protein [Oscillospiraceae bacterium]